MASGSNGGGGNCEEVISWLKKGGHYDELRYKMMDQLRTSAKLRKEAEAAIEASGALQACSTLVLDGNHKKEVYKQLRDELDKPLKDKVERHAWALISDQEGEVFQLLQHKVQEALCAVYEAKHQQELAALGDGGGRGMPGAG